MWWLWLRTLYKAVLPIHSKYASLASEIYMKIAVVHVKQTSQSCSVRRKSTENPGGNRTQEPFALLCKCFNHSTIALCPRRQGHFRPLCCHERELFNQLIPLTKEYHGQPPLLHFIWDCLTSLDGLILNQIFFLSRLGMLKGTDHLRYSHLVYPNICIQ